MGFHPDFRRLRAGDIKKLWRLAMALTEAASIRGVMEVFQDTNLRMVPCDGFMYFPLGRVGGPLPNKLSCHNLALGQNIWRDYAVEGYYKQCPVAVILSGPGLNNVPLRVNRMANFYETALYRELIKKYDVHTYLAMRMEYPGAVNILGLAQMAGARAYSPEDENILGILAPYLSRAFEYCNMLEAASNADPQAQTVINVSRRACLSRREIEILRQVARGLSNKETAERLYISELTVKTHMTRILRKTGARDRVELLAAMLGRDTSRVENLNDV